MVIFFAIFILTTLLILFGSNNSNEDYIPFRVASDLTVKTTDLKKWSGRDGYMPIFGNKVSCSVGFYRIVAYIRISM